MILGKPITIGGGGLKTQIIASGDVLSSDTVNATKGSKIVNGVWDSINEYFLLDNIDEGTWTVTATRGSESQSYSVVIDAVGRYEIVVSYSLLVYQGSDYGEAYSDDYVYQNTSKASYCYYDTAKIYGTSSDVYGQSRFVVFTTAVNYSLYSKMIITIYGNNSSLNEFIVGYSTVNTSQTSDTDLTQLEQYKPSASSSIYEHEIDISNVAGSHYPYVRCKMTNTYIYQIRFE